VPVRIGFKLFEDGKIESVEPAKPVAVETPIGSINAYDADALGIEADKNSLRFDRTGRLISLTTFDVITVRKSNGEKEIVYSKLRPGLIDDFEKVPIKLTFDGDTVSINDGTKKTDCRISECTFMIMCGNYAEAKICSDCSSCKSCI
jgi:hypothetical protein